MCFDFFFFPGSHNRVNQCPVNEHGCLDLDVCIHMSKVCDGVPDCSDGWDEGPHCRGNKLTEARAHNCQHPFSAKHAQNRSYHRFLYLLCRTETRVSAFVVGQKSPASVFLLASSSLPIQEYSVYPIISIRLFNELACSGMCNYNGIPLSGGKSH